VKDILLFNKPKNFTLSFQLNNIHFYLTFGAPFALGEAEFYKMKGRKTLSRSHNNLNTTDNNGLIESFSASTELRNAQAGI
jgi:hypothetical protein